LDKNDNHTHYVKKRQSICVVEKGASGIYTKKISFPEETINVQKTQAYYTFLLPSLDQDLFILLSSQSSL